MSQSLRTYSILTFAGVCQGLALALFLLPNAIPSGGATAIAVLFLFLLDIPVAFTIWFMNFTLLAIAIKYLGTSSAIRTMYTVTCAAITINLITNQNINLNFPVMLDLVYGAILFGIGVGVALRQRSSSGGMDIVALIIATYKGHLPGRIMFWINGSIFLITAIAINWKIIYLAILCQWLSTRFIDIIYTIEYLSRFVVIHWRRKQ